MSRALPRLEARLLALQGVAGDERAPALESLLNDGYAEVLALEGERAQLARRMGGRAGEAEAGEEMRAATRVRELERDIRALRELLDRAWALGPAGWPG